MSEIWDEIEKFYTERYKGWSGAKQFEGTGVRLRRQMEEMCWLPESIQTELRVCFKATFDDKFDEMLVSGPTSVWTLCPHHLLPVRLNCWIGYVPSGKVLGLSKFSRIAIISGRRPIMQEQYIRDVADSIMKNLEPQGVGVHIVGIHGCMGCRGVNQDIGVGTTALRGIFKTDPSVKDEFYRMVQGQ